MINAHQLSFLLCLLAALLIGPAVARAACEAPQGGDANHTYLRLLGGGGVLAANDPVPPVVRFLHAAEGSRWDQPERAGECFAIPARREASEAVLYIRYKPYRPKPELTIRLVQEGSPAGTLAQPVTVELALVKAELIVPAGPRKGRLRVEASPAAIVATYETYSGLAPRSQAEMLERTSQLIDDRAAREELIRGILEQAQADERVGAARRAESVLRHLAGGDT